MGFAQVKALICSPAQEVLRREVELLVDTGGLPGVVPKDVLVQFGIHSNGRRT